MRIHVLFLPCRFSDIILPLVAIESIKEIRAGADARNYREQFKIASDTEDRWITVIYLADGKYKTLHVVALAADVFQMWLDTLRHLYALRQELMSGVGNLERRQQAWERLYWKSADDRGDSKLAWPEVKKLCLRLNVHAPEEDLKQRFRVRVSCHFDITLLNQL